MFTIAEISKVTAITDLYIPAAAAFLIARKFSYGGSNEEIADFWTTTFGVTEPVTARVVIIAVSKGNINYSKKENLSECILDEESFYFNIETQVLYIHLNHLLSLSNGEFSTGVSVGLTNDKIRYFEDRIYYPYLIDFPQIEIQVDKFNYDQLAFIVDKISTSNKDGFFNQFKDTPIYGNLVQIKTGEEGDEYADLIERAAFYIEDYNFSALKFDINIQDIRKTLTASVPEKVFNDNDYPNIGDQSSGKTTPIGYGPLRDVPGFCVNEEAVSASVNPDFIFLEIITGSSLSDITVWVKDSDDVWIEQTSGVSVNWTTGVVTVSGAKALSGSTYNVLPVKADITGIENTYASDIIKDLNERFLGITYDSSNYDTTEWETEEVFLSPVGLYVNETKDIYEWIKEIQSISKAGFRYTNSPDNKRTIRVDNPNRTAAYAVPKIHIKNIRSIEAISDREKVFNLIKIGYNKSIVFDSAPRIEVDDYFNESFSLYGITSVYNKVSGLLNAADAEDRADIQAEDLYLLRQEFELILIGSQYLDLKVYDIINAEIVLTKDEIVEYDGIIQEVLSGSDMIADQLSGSDRLQEILSNLQLISSGDEYFGTVRGQVLSVKPDYDLGLNYIRIRQRDYSSIWESIYGT